MNKSVICLSALTVLSATQALGSVFIADDFSVTVERPAGTNLTGTTTTTGGATWKLSNTYAGSLQITADGEVTNPTSDSNHAFNYVDITTVASDEIITATVDLQLNSSSFSAIAIGGDLGSSYWSNTGGRIVGELQQSGGDRNINLYTTDGNFQTTVTFSDLPNNVMHSMELSYNRSQNIVSFSIGNYTITETLTGTYDGLDEVGLFILNNSEAPSLMDNFSVQTSTIPEPGSFACLAAMMGLLMVGFRRKRR